MFPLKKREITGYTFGQVTSYSNFHLGVDYGVEGLQVFAPFDGKITFAGSGQEGGNTLWLKPDGQDVVIRFLHLDKFVVHQGDIVKEGQILGITGNTGHSDAGHLHLDISKHAVNIYNVKNFINPEQFVWEKGTMKIYQDKRTNPPTIVAGFLVDQPSDLKWITQQCGLLLPLKPDGSVDFDKVTYDGTIS